MHHVLGTRVGVILANRCHPSRISRLGAGYKSDGLCTICERRNDTCLSPGLAVSATSELVTTA